MDCYTSHLKTPWGPIQLTQQGPDDFTVIYGLQTKSGLSYSRAASELGACIMHYCACEGSLDNSEIEGDE